MPMTHHRQKISRCCWPTVGRQRSIMHRRKIGWLFYSNFC